MGGGGWASVGVLVTVDAGAPFLHVYLYTISVFWWLASLAMVFVEEGEKGRGITI